MNKASRPSLPCVGIPSSRRRRQRLAPVVVIIIVLASQLPWPASIQVELEHYLLLASVLSAVAWVFDLACASVRAVFERLGAIIAPLLRPTFLLVRTATGWRVSLAWA